MLKEYLARHTRRVLVVAAAVMIADVASAQVVPTVRPFPPPSYGSPPPGLVGYELSQFGTGFNFAFIVSLSEAQKLLPAGYTALPGTDPTKSGISALVTINNLVTEHLGNGVTATHGPYESFDLVIGALNPAGVFESVLVARFVNNQEVVDLRQQYSGTIDTRYADIKVRMRNEGGVASMKVVVDDPDFGLKVTAVQTGSALIVASPRSFPPLGFGLGTVNTLVSPPTPGRGSRFAFSSDNSATFTDASALNVTRQQLRLAGGKVKVLSVQPGNFFFNQEVFVKLN